MHVFGLASVQSPLQKSPFARSSIFTIIPITATYLFNMIYTLGCNYKLSIYNIFQPIFYIKPRSNQELILKVLNGIEDTDGILSCKITVINTAKEMNKNAKICL